LDDPVTSASTPLNSGVSNPTASAELRFVVIGGGPVPESNEVSLEQDVDLVRRNLPGTGLVLFAGGTGSPTVRELSPTVAADRVRLELGDLFAPRPGRRSRYRAARFQARSATLDNVEQTLSAALAGGDGSLLVYIAAHGDRGDAARDNSVALWGGGVLSVARLAELHERRSRPMRLVATSCFSGGFGELAFASADPKRRRPSKVPRCGVFAGTADRETSGCDPNPNRRSQESYGLHLAHALAGQRKDGSPLPVAPADFDADGKIGLLDAHTWARIEAVSFDVPTTTSERWLRAVEPGSAPIDLRLSPEDAAVVERLGRALGVTDEQSASARWQELDRQIAAVNDELDDVEAELATSEDALATQLLERWPVLDDAFHPDFEATFAANRDAIAQLFERSDDAERRRLAAQRSDQLYGALDRAAVAEARILRLLRAYETLHKLAALTRRQGEGSEYYQRLLSCERAPL